ncbi:uncharacterized protein [Nicotiana tomentosiformis]|uniref:uncharacterized protein n=1 Tax=Nicotiana tomentosiformis TaxID=4098 RepID=UPI00388C975A
MAKYESCILGIRMTVNMNIKELLVIGDSNLLIHQVQGEWTTKNIKILPYVHYVKDLCTKFTKIEFKHVPRIHNEFADALATLSSMIKHPYKNYIDPIKIEFRDHHPYYFHVDEDPDDKPCHYDITRHHMNAFTLAKKILRDGYFWITMQSDSIRYMQKFHQCQIHGDFIRVPPNELNVMGSPWIFDA